MAKVRNLDTFGGCRPIPIPGPLSKNNSSMAALRTGLPVIRKIMTKTIGLFLRKFVHN